MSEGEAGVPHAENGSSRFVVSQHVAGAYSGSHCRIVQCAGALESLEEALVHVPSGRHLSLMTALRDQMKRHADGGRMSKENFPIEGVLPVLPGKKGGKRFRAYKKIPLRGYCWLSDAHPGTFFVSHYIYKDQNDLDARDTNRVHTNWYRIEREGDER